MKITGKCLCGEVCFSLTGTVEGFYFCHCTRCQKSTGTIHGSNLFFSNAEINWLSGENNLVDYKHKNTRFCKHFCKNCGSPLPRTIDPSSNMAQVPVGSLTEDLYFEPTAHLFTGRKRCWEEKLPTLKAFPGFPE